MSVPVDEIADVNDDAAAKSLERSLDEHPLDRKTLKSYFSTVTFAWLQHLLRIGAKRPIQAEDIWSVPERYRADHVAGLVVPAWKAELDLVAKGVKRKPNLLRALLPVIRTDLRRAVCLLMIAFCFITAAPLTMNQLLRNLLNPDANVYSEVLPWALAFSGIFLTMGHVMPQVNFHGSRMGATMRFAVQQLVFRTSLTMSLETKQAQSANIVNLMSVDSERFFTVCQSLFVINSFLTIIASAVILSQFLNWYALSAVLLFALAMPLQVTIGKRLGRFRGLMSKHMAARMSATSNFLTGIRIVKASGWVDPALQVIAKHRQLEVSELRKVLLCRGANLTIAFVVTPLATLTMFGLYAVAGNGPMQPERVFTALAALRGLQMPMMMMPVMVSNIFEFLIAKNRVENFLCDVAANPGGRAALKDTSKSGGCVTIEKA
eukprot:TRINITY_DN23454_c0_g1_i3.p1 TRINITY_DN23454_c0_g1~~TRINITY_DN23454_c0_g1_i3.p1  ORF type:complete len:434 (+),score=40.84 TRINITY_DN23454_c0_g1_i3:62-1363(+)